MGRPIRALVLTLALALGPALGVSSASAQSVSPTSGSILTISSDRLYSESQFGKRIAQDLEEDGKTLAAENRRIEGLLTEEERRMPSTPRSSRSGPSRTPKRARWPSAAITRAGSSFARPGRCLAS